jgi:hypothetical protein
MSDETDDDDLFHALRPIMPASAKESETGEANPDDYKKKSQRPILPAKEPRPEPSGDEERSPSE